MYEHRLTTLDFEALWGEHLSPWVADRLELREMRYAALGAEQRDQALRKVIAVLMADLPKSGRHRNEDWEVGWAENLHAFRSVREASALIPGYFNKIPIVRWRQELVSSISPTLEFDLFATLLDWILDTRIPSECTALYEFGCGTGHNLLRARERFPDSTLTGLDWATSSQDAVREYANRSGDLKLFAAEFDYFAPDTSLSLAPDACVLTVASLEQVGHGFNPFIDYLCEQEPSLIVHIEPIAELLDPSNLLDYLSIEYFKKRNYLEGLLDELKIRESRGEIEILEARRTYVGSFYIDGYSLIVWRPRSSS